MCIRDRYNAEYGGNTARSAQHFFSFHMARTPKIVILFIVLVATVLLSLVFLLRTSYNISYPNAQRSSSTYGSFKRSQCSKLPQRKRMRTPIPSPKINTTAVDILTEELELANRTFQSERKMRIDAELKLSLIHI
eukprot:TRINITY_DN5581_c0_g1_i2.p1 TRINITY_DN5581_c0_g1~~TRINITY_DN5581_c0_g1_i2.p1  ORF type:complete len:135 (-),score=5.85 TRINITY_DN5581_c0_g1_i2:26-430(-)